MSAPNATASVLASRYATALFDLAVERKALDKVEGDLAALDQANEVSPDLARALKSPVVSRVEHAQTVEALAGELKLGEITTNLLGVLAHQRRLAELQGVATGFRALLARHRGEETAEVISAQPLDAEQVEALKASVASYVGRAVSLTASVDPGLIGGLVVRIGSRMIDASLKTKLHQLELSMRGIR